MTDPNCVDHCHPEDIANLLEDTGEYIEDHGWTDGEFFDEDGKVCTVGGMLGALGLDDCQVYDRRVLYGSRALADSLKISAHHNKCSREGPCSCPVNWVTTWNDMDGRTEQEVLDALAKAAKTLRAGFDPDAA